MISCSAEVLDLAVTLHWAAPVLSVVDGVAGNTGHPVAPGYRNRDVVGIQQLKGLSSPFIPCIEAVIHCESRSQFFC